MVPTAADMCPAFANWWIVRSSDGECLVVDIEPVGAGVTKVGKAITQHRNRQKPMPKRSVKSPSPEFRARSEQKRQPT